MRKTVEILVLLIGAACLIGAAYTPVPDESGAQFRADVNARFSGAQPISPAFSTTQVAVSTAISFPSQFTDFNCNAASGALTFTLPPASHTGEVLVFKKVDTTSNPCTINVFGGLDKIDGASSFTLSARYDWVALVNSNTGTWSIISQTASSGGGGTLAGDASGAAGSNTVNTVLGGQTPISASTSMTGDLAGNLPAPTVARMHLGITAVTHGASPYSASSADSALECDATGGAVSISLPGTSTGKMIVIKKIDSTTNACTITTALDGTANYQLSAQNQSITAYYNASTTHWNVLSGNATTAMDSIAGIAGGVSDSVSNMSVNGVFNVKSPKYGATGSGIFGTDDSAAIQAAIDAACASNNVSDLHVSASTVYFPPGSYRMSYPAWVNCAGLTLAGAGIYASVLSPTYDAGKTIILAPGSYPGVPLASPLVGSTGNSFDFTQDRSHRPFLNLREWDGLAGPLASVASCTGANTPSKGCTGTGTGNFGLNLNGLGAFTVEYFVDELVLSYTLGAAGTGYAVNDTGTITTGGGNATYKITAVSGGAVTTFTITAPGTGYSTGNGQATATGGAQPGSGSGFTVNIVSPDGAVVSSGSTQSVSLGFKSAFFSGIGSARWLDSINLSGSGLVSLNPAGSITTATNYYRAFAYDGTTCRQYAWDPLESTCRHASLSIL